jgi:hypothetical protein
MQPTITSVEVPAGLSGIFAQAHKPSRPDFRRDASADRLRNIKMPSTEKLKAPEGLPKVEVPKVDALNLQGGLGGIWKKTRRMMLNGVAKT